MANNANYPNSGKPAQRVAARGGKLYPYLDNNGVERRAKLRDLPPHARDFVLNETRKRLAKYRKMRREREARALTLRTGK